MMGRKIAAVGDEQDCFGRGHLAYGWRPGERKAIKRRANKRDRRHARAEIREQR